ATLEGPRHWWTTIVTGSPGVGGELRFGFAGLGEQIVMRVDRARPPIAVGWSCVAHTRDNEWTGSRVSAVWARNVSMGAGRYWMARWAASCQALLDEGGGELLEVMAGGVGDVAQGPLPGEHGQPVHRGPDGVLDAVAAPPVEDAGVGQFVERGAQVIQGHAVR